MDGMNYMRLCARCEQDKPLSAFGLLNGLPRSWCKACRVAYETARYAANKGKHRDENKRRRLANLPLYKERERKADAKRRENPAYLASARESASRVLKEKHQSIGKVTACVGCGITLCWLLGRQSTMTRCLDCSTTHAIRYNRAKAAARRAQKRTTQVEHVDPYRVFDRDGWRCRLCGIRTPETKRGSYADNAPELDHINPLSQGGEHSYMNTQCACRKCNLLKSNKPLGQTLMFA